MNSAPIKTLTSIRLMPQLSGMRKTLPQQASITLWALSNLRARSTSPLSYGLKPLSFRFGFASTPTSLHPQPSDMMKSTTFRNQSALSRKPNTGPPRRPSQQSAQPPLSYQQNFSTLPPRPKEPRASHNRKEQEKPDESEPQNLYLADCFFGFPHVRGFTTMSRNTSAMP